MASYHDLLDAIARIRSVTGDSDAWKKGLTGDDVTVVCTPASPPDAVGAVLAKLTAAHPDVFLSPSPAGEQAPPPRIGEGAAADAIRAAETALARQNTEAAHIDLQVVTAVLNAHAAHEEGLTELVALQRDIEAAVASRTDLDTPAGAREFQRFLVAKLRDIRVVVEKSSLDSTSKASLAAALAALYASTDLDQDEKPSLDEHTSEGRRVQSEPGCPPRAPTENSSRATAPAASAGPSDPVADIPLYGADLPTLDSTWTAAPPPSPASLDIPPASPPAQTVAPPPAAAMPVPATPPAMTPPPAMAMPPWNPGLPLGGGFPALGSPPSAPATVPELPRADLPSRSQEAAAHDLPGPVETADEPSADGAPADPATIVELPDGDTVTAPTPALAAAITAAVGGTPIPDAFGQQGITIPVPGSAVNAPLDPLRLTPGDVGVLSDRHALALGHGKVLLDRQIQTIGSVAGPDFLGWQHPPEPQPAPEPPTAMPDVPAPNRSPATAPS